MGIPPPVIVRRFNRCFPSEAQALSSPPVPPSRSRLHWLRDLNDADVPAAAGALPARADVVIVGGGYMGCATAMWLARAGVQAVLVERRGIATGASGRNAGFIAPGLGLATPDVIARGGRASALERLRFEWRGRDLVLALVKELATDVELEALGGLTLAASPREWETLVASGADLRREGFPVETLAQAELQDHIAAPVPDTLFGGLFNPETLLVNPARLCRAIAEEAHRQGARLFTNTEVTAIDDAGERSFFVSTSRGITLARHVVVAMNAWTPLVVGLLKDRIRPVRGQMLATAPAPRTFLRAMSANEGYEYWSQRHDGRIVLGGARWAVADRDEGYYAEDVNTTIQSALYQFLTESFPSLAGIPVERRWSGIMGFSRDGFPLIGPLPERPGMFVIAGFTGHGGPYAVIAGQCIADLIRHGKTDEAVHLFALDRATLA